MATSSRFNDDVFELISIAQNSFDLSIFSLYAQQETKDETPTVLLNRYPGGGAMVAIYPPLEVAEAIAVEGGEEVDALHVTLMYLGKVADTAPGDEKRVTEVVQRLACETKPFTVRVSGFGQFTTPDEDGKVAQYASIDDSGGGLRGLRLACEVFLDRWNVSEHGFTPHRTLAYVDATPEVTGRVPRSVEWTVDRLYLCWNDTKLEFALEGMLGFLC